MDSNGGGNKAVMTLIAAVTAFMVLIVVGFATIIGSSDDDCLPETSVGGGVAVPSADGTVKPMKQGTYQLTSGFGARWGTNHNGQDLAGPLGTPIYAFADGVVTKAGEAQGFGQWIIIEHNIKGKRVATVYGHMFPDGVLVKVGQSVKAGQLIAKEGNNGQSTGPHLHFEVHPGGYVGTGVNAVDPAPWLAAAGEPGLAPAPAGGAAAGGGAPVPTSAPPFRFDPAKSVTDNVVAAAMSQLGVRYSYGGGALDGPSGGDDGIGWDCSSFFRYAWYQGTNRAVELPRTTDPQQAFGQPVPGGYAAIAPGDGIFWPGHVAMALGNGMMIEAPETGQVVHVTKLRAGGEVRRFGDKSISGGAARNVSASEPGAAAPGQAAAVGAAAGTSSGSCPTTPGGDSPAGGGTDNLGPGSVPAAFEPWLRRAGTRCPQISSALLAAQLEQENGFKHGASAPVSSTGAQGPAQFMPGTWAAYGKDYDGDGRADVNSIGDAVMSQADYMCTIAKIIDGAIASGKVRPSMGGPAGLYLAGYNAGEGAVLSAGGMPSGGDYSTQTQPYVARILSRVAAFQAGGLQ